MKKYFSGAILITLGLLLSSVTAQAQQITVNGTVTDSQTGKPLIGVNILVTGSRSGGVTDASGRFSVTVPSLQDSLRFSYIGYETKTIPINGRTTISVTMKSKVISGEQMVVIGYGKQKKMDLTGSVASVSAQDLKTQSITNPAAMLQGMLPGLRVTKGSGQPGTGFQCEFVALAHLVVRA